MIDTRTEATARAWLNATRRALAADLPHHLRCRVGAVLVPSKSQDGITYHVQVVGGRVGQCDCPAGLNGRPCAHRAAVVIRLYERETGALVSAVKPAGIPALMRRLVEVQQAAGSEQEAILPTATPAPVVPPAPVSADSPYECVGGRWRAKFV